MSAQAPDTRPTYIIDPDQAHDQALAEQTVRNKSRRNNLLLVAGSLLLVLVVLAIAAYSCSRATPAAAVPTPTPTEAAAAFSTPAPTAIATATVPPATSSGAWKEVDFHPADDRQDIDNVDHNGQNRITISWFWASGGTTPPADPCTAHVTSAKNGERITFKGAYRTWQWTGTAPSKEQVQALVKSWIKVLEEEPRGMCAHKGAYSVSWQDASLKP